MLKIVDIAPSTLTAAAPGITLLVELDIPVGSIATSLLIGDTYPVDGYVDDIADSWLIKVNTGSTRPLYFIVTKNDIVADSVSSGSLQTYTYTGSISELSDDEGLIRLAFASIFDPFLTLGGSQSPGVLSDKRSVKIAIDNTKKHDFRIVGQNGTIKIFVDGQLAIVENLVSTTKQKSLEFGNIATCSDPASAIWENLQATTTGAFDPDFSPEISLDEILSFSKRKVSLLGTCNNELYIVVDPIDNSQSSEVYRYMGGVEVPVDSYPLTKSYVSSVVVDKNVGNVFGTSAKYVGTDRGIQYILGSKPFPFDSVTAGGIPGEEWALEDSCSADCASSDGRNLTIDTSAETTSAYWKYVQSKSNSVWANADNSTGWTVEATVKITNDGSAGSIDAIAADISASNCGINEEDGLNAPGIYINDGTYSETIQFFQHGIRLKQAKFFAPQEMSDQFYSVRIVGRRNAIAVFVKGETESGYKRVIFAPNSFTHPAAKKQDMDAIHACVDATGDMHVVWHQDEKGTFSVQYAKYERVTIVSGSLRFVSVGTVASSTDFLAAGVKVGDDIVISTPAVNKRYIISAIVNKNTLTLRTADDLSKILPAGFKVISKDMSWGPTARIAGGNFDCTNPRICIQEDNLFVAYSSIRYGRSEIYCRTGTLKSSGVVWGRTVQITNSTRNSKNPDICTSGSYLIIPFESYGADGQRIGISEIPILSFGNVRPTLSFIHPPTTESIVASGIREPRIAAAGSEVMIVYAIDTSIAIQDIDTPVSYIAANKIESSSGTAVFGTVQILIEPGQSDNPVTKVLAPSVVGFFSDGIPCFAAAWEHVFKYTSSLPNTFPATSFDVSTISFSFNIPSPTSPNFYSSFIDVAQSSVPSCGQPYMATVLDGTNSKSPSLCVFGNMIICGFETDRRRKGIFEPFLFKAQISNSGNPIDDFSCGNFGFLETKLTALSDGTGICLVADSENLGVFRANDIDGTMIVSGAASDGKENSNLGIVAYYNMRQDPTIQDNSDGSYACLRDPNNYNRNMIRTLDSTGRFVNPTVEIMGATAETPKISGTLIGKSGAIEICFKAVFMSNINTYAAYIRTFNEQQETVNPNSFICGILPGTTSGSLALRIVDSSGVVHQTSSSLNLFNTGDYVKVRFCWDSNAIGTSVINDIFLRNGYQFSIDGFGLAVGDAGSIYRTSNYGATWTKVNSGTDFDLYCICESTEGKIFVGGEAGTILSSSNNGITWIRETISGSGELTADIFDICISTHTYDFGFGLTHFGLAVADGYLVEYLNGNWQFGLRGLDDLNHFISIGKTEHGDHLGETFICVGKSFVYRQTIQQSGGLFDFVKSDIDAVGIEFSGVTKTVFEYNNKAFLCGSGGHIFQTLDNGITWTNVSPVFPDGSRPEIKKVVFVNDAQIAALAEGKILYNGAIYGGLDIPSWKFFDAKSMNCIAATVIPGPNPTIVAGGHGGLVMRSSGIYDQIAINQIYQTMPSENLTILVNGIDVPQTRVNDYPFNWTPRDLVVDIEESGGGKPIQITIFNDPPAHTSSVDKNTIRSIKLDPALIGGSVEDIQRIEWGNISPLAKGVSQWREFKTFTCGAREPVRIFVFDTRMGLSDDVVNSLTISPDGILWAATNNGISAISTSKIVEAVDRWLTGLPEQIDNDFIETYGTSAGLPLSPILEISSSELGVFASTEKSLFKFFRPILSNPNSDPASQQNIVSSVKALGSFLPVMNFASPINTIRAFNDIVYVGTKNGLYSGIASLSLKKEFAGINSKTIARDTSGILWVGTDNGLISLSKSLAQYGPKNGLIGSNINSMFIDNNGLLVMGTNFGISIFDGQNFLTVPPSKIGDIITLGGDCDASDHYWFASPSGLLEIDLQCSKHSVIDVNDGLLGDLAIVDYQHYQLSAIDGLKVGCNKPASFVRINGLDVTDGYDIDYKNMRLNFGHPRLPSDIIDIAIHPGLRRINVFGDELASLSTESTKYYLYRKNFSAGTIILGGASSIGFSGDSVRNYSVIVVPIYEDVNVSIDQPNYTISKFTSLGAQLYSDVRDSITEIPSEVIDGIRIITADGDAQDVSDNFLVFSVSTACRVYIAYDSNAKSIPDWLRDFSEFKTVSRISDMIEYTDASKNKKLYLGVKGSNGCVSSIFVDPTVCDISSTTALDAEAPTGCATITAINSSTNVTLSISATDKVTGVSEMQISPNADFTDDGTNVSKWVPYQTVYNYEFPQAAVSSTVASDSFPSGTGSCMTTYQGKIVAGTASPGLVYVFDSNSGGVSRLFDTQEDEVVCMIEFNGKLIVGTGSLGKLFSWDGTTLSPFSNPVGTRITGLGIYNGSLYVGASPNGQVWRYDTTGSFQLFNTTQDTSVNGFAVFGNVLYYVTSNSVVTSGDALVTTITEKHSHSFSVLSDNVLELLNGTTSLVNGHAHTVINGVVQPATDGHTHILNGTSAGKIYSYEAASGQIKIAHADTDYAIKTIAGSTTNLYAGTYPHGKILRLSGDIFVKSFQTPKNDVRKIKNTAQSQMVALVDEDAYVLTSSAWNFKAAVAGRAKDVLQDSTAGELLILNEKSILKTASKSSGGGTSATQLCLFIRFKDKAGNITSIIDPKTGKVPTCYNPCKSTTPTTGTGPGQKQVLSNRLFEIDETGKVSLSLNGSSTFFAGNRIEKEQAAYYSEVFNGTSSLVRWETISWDAVVPTGTYITIAVRTATSSSGISSAAFGEEFTDATSNGLTTLPGQFLQFRATLVSTVPNSPSPTLNSVSIRLRTSQSTHFYTTNFKLPDKLARAILTYNGCINPPATDLIFGISGLDSTDFGDYYIIPVNKAFDIPPEHRTDNLRVGIKFISSPTEVPVVDEFAILVSLANDAKIKLNAPGTPSESLSQPVYSKTRTVYTDKVQNHTHSITFDSSIADKAAINAVTSVNAGHYHQVINGIVQSSAGHTHDFSI